MKALTFKKSAVAAALLAVAGSASAASTMKFATYSTTEVATDVAMQTVAAEPNTVAAKAFTVIGDVQGLAVTLPSTSLTANSLVKFDFTNGGLDSSDGYVIARGDSNQDFEVVSTSVFSQTASNGVITSLTLQLGGSVTIAQGDTIYLFNDTAASEAVGNNFEPTANSGLVLKAVKGAAHNSDISVKFTADHANAGVTDSIFDSTELKVGKVLNGLNLKGFTTETANVNFSNDALTFVAGGNVTTTSVAASGLMVEPAKYSVSNSTYTLDQTSGSVLTDPVTVGNYEYDLTISATNCAALKETGGLAISAGTLVKSTTTDCTWTVADVAAENSLTLTATVDGTTALSNNTFSVAYDVNFDDSSTLQDDIYAGKSSTAIVWNTDVQSNGTKSFPYLVAANNNSSTWSYIKMDNTGNTKDTQIAVKGTIEDRTTGTEYTFKNYLVKTLAAGTLDSLTGDEIVDALITPTGSADDGFNTTALELDKTHVFHISVTLDSVSGGGDLDNVKMEALNASSAGRSQISGQ
jgi:hypothetical protein